MKRLAIAAAAVIGVLLVAALIVPYLTDPNRYRPLLEEELSQAMARQVKLGDLKLSLLAGAVKASDLSIADDPAFSRRPFLEAKSLAVAIELWPLIKSRQVRVTGLTIDHPSVALIQSAGGEWNFSSLGGKTKAPAASKSDLELSVKDLRIIGARFSLDRTGGRHKPLVLEDVNLEARDFSSASAFPFTLSAKVEGGGSVKLDGTAGPLDAADTAASPFAANITIGQLDLARTGLAQDAPAVAGLVSLAGDFKSDGKTGQFKGKLKGEKLKLAKSGTPANRAVEFDFAATHNMRKRSGRLDRGDLHIGAALARLTGTFAEENGSTSIRMTLDGPQMPIPELAGLLPALGVVLPNGSSLQGGTATVKLSVDGVLDRLVTAGSVSLDNTKLTGFDMGKKMAAIEMLAGIQGGPSTEIQTFSSGVRMGPEGMAANNIRLVVPAIGTLDGSGTVSPANALDFRMRATVRAAGLLSAASNTPIPFTIGGTAQDPVFRPDVKSAVKEQAGKAAGSILKGILGGK